MRKRFTSVHLGACLFVMAALVPALSGATFTAFESGQVRPMAMSQDGDRLFVVNTPDNRLEIFDLTGGSPVIIDSVPVGMEPVAVAARSNDEVWVVNHLSDSVSVIDVSAVPGRMIRTLLVGDEPRDIVFAGPARNRAFITTAHRGQNSPYVEADDPGEFTVPGIGRADVWVFDAAQPSFGSLGFADALTIVTLFGDTPRPLAVSPDGSTVYAGVFHSGNRTTTLNEGVVCNGGASAGPCMVDGVQAPGGLPAPNVDSDNQPQPETGLIVKYDGTHWKDELGRNWDGLVRFNLPDKDVFAIDANANPPVETQFYTGVGTVLYNMAVHPVTGRIFVANTEAFNEVRFEGTRAPGSSVSSVIGRTHQTRITIIEPDTGIVIPRHLNTHIDYSISPAPPGTAEKSLALPRQLVFSNDGRTLYLAAKGSDKVGIFDAVQLEGGGVTPSSSTHVTVSGGGPEGVLIDEARGRLYVTTRFDNGLSVVDTGTATEIDHLQLHNPESASITFGRRFLYDANLSSSNGEAACASCHIDGDLDSLAWDLGDPTGSIVPNPLDFALEPFNNPPQVYRDFHPMKGPMTTQTLRGMAGHGPMHWRGDRFNSDGSSPNAQPDGGVYEEMAAFRQFAGAFETLLGRAEPLSYGEMQSFAEFILQVTMPPNPIRNLDNSFTPAQAAGLGIYLNDIVDTRTCNSCHVFNPEQGFFGTDGRASFEGESQHLKIPQLRNMYAKVGMFGMPAVPFFNAGNNQFQGNQIRGFGFLHDGSTDTLMRFLDASLFTGFSNDTQRRQVEQFLFAFDSNLKPVVGQQVSLSDTNANVVGPRIDLLLARASVGDADIIVKGVIDGVAHGWVCWGGSCQGDGTPSLSVADLRALASVPGQVLTWTAVPPGSGFRAGIDRDEDGYLDGHDNCPAVDNEQDDVDGDHIGDACDGDNDNDGLPDTFESRIGTDPLKADTDLDGLSDGEEVGHDGDISEYLHGIDTNPLRADTDGDGLSDAEEVGYDGDYSAYTPGQDLDPLAVDTDGDGIDDGVDPIPLTVNVGDGDLTADGSVNAADLLIATRVVLGLLAANETHLAHGDLYPSGAPDGALGIPDLILLQQLLLQ